MPLESERDAEPRPYLCSCGAIFDVAAQAPGDTVQCPRCDATHLFDERDPGLLSNFSGRDGRYAQLLEKQLSEGALPAAIPVEGVNGDSASDDASARAAIDPTETAAIPTQVAANLPFAGDTRMKDLGPDSTIGPFKIEKVLGRGGMGIVYQAFDSSLQRRVALKVLPIGSSRQQEFVDRFEREARAAGRLNHPNITHVYSIGKDDDFHWFAMELVRGQTLSALIESKDRFLEETAIEHLLQAARGLSAAKKQGITHRDIKPSNLMLSDDGVVKITDFGLAKVQQSPADLTQTGVIIGTPLYMSPEQGQGEPLDHRSDIYSLGCSFYHLLAGSPPFEGESAMRIIIQHITDNPPSLALKRSDLDAQFVEIIERMIQKSPLDRYQDYEELIQALDRLTEQQSSPGSSSRVDGGPQRVVLMTDAPAPEPEGPMGLKQLSVADVNLQLGRLERALNLYQRVLADEPGLERELGFRIVRILSRSTEDRTEELQHWYERLTEISDCSKEQFYCRWKQVQSTAEVAKKNVSDLAQGLQALLEGELPPEIPTRRLKLRLQELQDLERRLERDLGTTVLLIRRSGEMQIELE